MFEAMIEKYRLPIIIFLVGFSIFGFGLLVFRTETLGVTGMEVSVIEDEEFEIVIDIAGAVKNPGVYTLAGGSRVVDAIEAAGGFTDEADLTWVLTNLNRAALLVDGQKLRLPKQSETTSANNNVEDQTRSSESNSRGSGGLNINTASLKELDSLPGIGPVYGQNIIEQRPYSSVEELLQKSVLKKSVYESVKDLVSVY